MTGWTGVWAATAATGCTLVGGVFFAFSGFVMPALRRLPAPTGVTAMQAINVAAVAPPLMIALFGTAAAAVVVPMLSWRAGADHPTQVLGWVAGGLYLVGTVGVTVGGNVALNDELAQWVAESVDDSSWTGWVDAWTRWNHLRTAAALVAAALSWVSLLRSAS